VVTTLRFRLDNPFFLEYVVDKVGLVPVVRVMFMLGSSENNIARDSHINEGHLFS